MAQFENTQKRKRMDLSGEDDGNEERNDPGALKADRTSSTQVDVSIYMW